MNTHPAPTPRTELKRAPQRGRHDSETVRAILDESLICHVGFMGTHGPVVIPTIHARIDGLLYLHGSSANRMLRSLRDGVDACLTATVIDGLVLARSAFHHSMNYRSVMVFGRATEVRDPIEKRAALEALVEHVVPGRSMDVRPPNEKELLRTLVLRLPLDEASAKIRSGPPIDEEEDREAAEWAGVIPVALATDTPVPDAWVRTGTAPPGYATRYARPIREGE